MTKRIHPTEPTVPRIRPSEPTAVRIDPGVVAEALGAGRGRGRPHDRLRAASGDAELDGVVEASKRLLAAELELAATGAERIAAYERHLKMAQLLVAVAKARQESGRGTAADVLDAQASSLEAQIGLLKAGGKVNKAEK
jgi:outer membrane protein TolC